VREGAPVAAAEGGKVEGAPEGAPNMRAAQTEGMEAEGHGTRETHTTDLTSPSVADKVANIFGAFNPVTEAEARKGGGGGSNAYRVGPNELKSANLQAAENRQPLRDSNGL